MKGSLPWKRPRGQGVKFSLSLSCLVFLLNGCSSFLQDNPHFVEHPIDQWVIVRDSPASLTCKAQGDPKPKIEWYKNGAKITRGHHRILLDDDERLFFLRIIDDEDTSDLGVYYCNATNIHGSAISQEATLRLAYIWQDFREQPKSITVASGETATFRCKPPIGEPRPELSWKKNGNVLKEIRRHDVTSDGTLVISSVRPDDAGKYTCHAKNQGGERQSKAATLTVLEKPTFREMPEDITGKAGETVEMKCKASGDPPPKIEWRKENGHILFGRARQLNDGTLRIEKISIPDDGLYVCVAQNSAGTVEAVGRLTVQTPPSFVVTPKDITVGLGRTATFQCVVKGNPPPTVFWKGTDQNLMFHEDDYGRFSVSEDGTLRIVGVQYADEQTYTCQGLNVLGDPKASAKLTVVGDDSRPPPVIVQGPSNLTVEPKETALLACQVDGTPHPSIRWYKNGHLLLSQGDRVVVLSTGSLKIMNTRISDSGAYECVAWSETGETKWKATLRVSKTGPFHKTEDPTSLPGPPSKLRVSDITDTSVHLTWVPSAVVGQSSVFAYIVEFFSRDEPGGWQTASDTISHQGYTVSNLKPEKQYVFLVRAKNSHGIGPPSPVSDSITTREKRPSHGVNLPKPEIRKELGLLKLELKSGKGINSTAIKVKWEVSTSLTAIEGYYVFYTLVKDLDSNEKGETKRVTIADSYTFGCNITGLDPYSWYDVCVSAYSQGLMSPYSNYLKIRTNESVPSAPPQDVIVHKEDDTFKLQWAPPPAGRRHGRILGYYIECLPEDIDGDNSRSSSSSTNGDDNNKNGNCSTMTDGKSRSIIISNIMTDGTYNIRIAARTSQGRGVWSKMFVLGPETSDIMEEAWFIWLIAGSIGGALWLALCVFSFWMCRRRRRDKKQKMAQNGMYSAVPVHKSEESGRAGSVVIQRDDVMYSQKDGTVHNYGGLQSDLTSLLDCAGPKDGLDGSQVYSSASTTLPQMKTFYQRPGPGGPSMGLSVAPYATTTLINTAASSNGGTLGDRKGQTNTVDSGFRPINHAYVHSSASGSGDSCHKPELRSSESNQTDLSRANTGHYSYAAGCAHEHCECMTSPGSDSSAITTDENGLPVRREHDHKYCKITCPSCVAAGKQQQQQNTSGQPVMNWAELIPPPPEHPPPSSEGGSGSGGGDHSGDSAIHLPPHHHLQHHHLHHIGHPPYFNTNSSSNSSNASSSNNKNNNSSANNNMAETRFIENRSPMSPVSKISACSCPPAPHERIFPDLRGNPPAYSDVAYPISHPHPGTHPRNIHHCGAGGGNPNHSGSGSGSGCGCSYHEGSGASSGGGSQCNFRPQSPATTGYNPRMQMHPMQYPGSNTNTSSSNNSNPNNMASAETLLHRCQSPMSCHNCGNNVPPQPQPHQLLQQPSSNSTTSSSQNSNKNHHPHHPHSMSASGSSMSQRPYMGAGGGVDPNAHLYSPAYPSAPTSLPGYRISILGQPVAGNGSSNRDSSDLEQAAIAQGHLYPSIGDEGFEGQGRHQGQGHGTLDRGCQSSIQGYSDDGMPMRVSMNSEVPDYATESDMEVQRATDCPTPDSSSNGEGSISGSMHPYWSSLTEDSSTDMVSQADDEIDEDYDEEDENHHRRHHPYLYDKKDDSSNDHPEDNNINNPHHHYDDIDEEVEEESESTNNEENSNRQQHQQQLQQQHQQQQQISDKNNVDSTGDNPSLLTDTDFASAVARAAELSGMTVVGTTISDPKTANGNKKYRKHRTTPTTSHRPSSPYSTDSNLSAVVHKPYPKSERKKQLLEQARKYGPQRKELTGLQDIDGDSQESDIPVYHRPYYPTLPLHHNNHSPYTKYNNNNNINNSANSHFYNYKDGSTSTVPSTLTSDLQRTPLPSNTGTLRSTASGGYAMPPLPTIPHPHSYNSSPAPSFNRSMSSPAQGLDHSTPEYTSSPPAPFIRQRPPSSTFGAQINISTHLNAPPAPPPPPPPPPPHPTSLPLSHTDVSMIPIV